MRRIDDYIRAGAEISIREDFIVGIDRRLDDSGRRVSDAESEREMAMFTAMKAASGA